jgi:hypothetical protein
MFFSLISCITYDFYQGVEGYYAENPASRIKVVKKGKKPPWKLSRDKDFALKGYETDSDGSSDEEHEFEE